jgi:cytochrome c peroxidase
MNHQLSTINHQPSTAIPLPPTPPIFAAMNKAVSFICLLLATACCFSRCLQTPPATADDIRSLLPAVVTDSIYLAPNNPYSAAQAQLGRYLFYDRRLSFNQTKSCATCHDPKFSFTDNYRRSIGATGDVVQRNAPPLINLIFNKYLTAADSTLHFPEQQIRNPLFHTSPVELGWTGNEEKIRNRLRADTFYQRSFREAFPGQADPLTLHNLQRCIASFVKTIFSFNSAYDNYTLRNQPQALDAAALRGKALFFSDTLACGKCHSGINFNAPQTEDSSGRKIYYFNTGLYNLDGKGAYPAADQGLIETTGNAADRGKYRVPTLRNLIFTAPYFHDGSAATLSEVINSYAAGGRVTAQGDGRTNPFKHPLIQGFQLNSQQGADLVHFLLSLTDSSVCTNPAYANPFVHDETKQ